MSTEQPESNSREEPEQRDAMRGHEPGRRTRDSKSKWVAIASAVTVFAVIVAVQGLIAADESGGDSPESTETGMQQDIADADSSAAGVPGEEQTETAGAGADEDLQEDDPVADESSDEDDKDTAAGTITVQGGTDDDSSTEEDDETSEPVSWGAELENLTDLGSVAGSKTVVFAYLPAEDTGDDEELRSEIEAAANSVKNEGFSVGLFTLAHDSGDYTLVEVQYSTPAVVILVRGAGGAVVSEEITEDTLLSGLAAAADPSSSSCC
ncbi:MAG: hypothetical protein ACOC9B_03435 [Chloroflexota bacterium]